MNKKYVEPEMVICERCGNRKVKDFRCPYCQLPGKKENWMEYKNREKKKEKKK